MSDAEQDIEKTDPRALARIMEVDQATRRLWKPREMGAILRHQLAAPAEGELRSVKPQLAARFAEFGEERQGEDLRTFGDLFRHPDPPLELLRLTKDFAKTSRNDPDNPVPNELPTVLYFASISLAELRWEKRITSLSDAEIAKGLDWVIAQHWVESDLRQMLQKARMRF